MGLAFASRAWELPLFVHVLGAMLLVGALAAAATALVVAWRSGAGGGELALTRFAFWALAAAALPSWLVMRVAAQWVQSESPFGDEATWVGIGYAVSEGGLVLMLVATALAGLGMRRLARDGAGSTLGRAAGVVTLVLVVAYLVAVWAMTTKPD